MPGPLEPKPQGATLNEPTGASRPRTSPLANVALTGILGVREPKPEKDDVRPIDTTFVRPPAVAAEMASTPDYTAGGIVVHPDDSESKPQGATPTPEPGATTPLNWGGDIQRFEQEGYPTPSSPTMSMPAPLISKPLGEATPATPATGPTEQPKSPWEQAPAAPNPLPSSTGAPGPDHYMSPSFTPVDAMGIPTMLPTDRDIANTVANEFVKANEKLAQSAAQAQQNATAPISPPVAPPPPPAAEQPAPAVKSAPKKPKWHFW